MIVIFVKDVLKAGHCRQRAIRFRVQHAPPAERLHRRLCHPVRPFCVACVVTSSKQYLSTRFESPSSHCHSMHLPEASSHLSWQSPALESQPRGRREDGAAEDGAAARRMAMRSARSMRHGILCPMRTWQEVGVSHHVVAVEQAAVKFYISSTDTL